MQPRIPKPHLSTLQNEQRIALHALVGVHQRACLRYAQQRRIRGLDRHCRRLLDQVKLSRSLLLAVLEDSLQG